jgi:hypothetical protein
MREVTIISVTNNNLNHFFAQFLLIFFGAILTQILRAVRDHVHYVDAVVDVAARSQT